MTDYAGRLLAYSDEMHLRADRPLTVGDKLKVVRGNGPREGEYMGTATVTGFDDDGGLTFDLHPGDDAA